MGGILFTLTIAFIGFFLAKIPGISHVGQMACAILVAVTYRQLFGYPNRIRTGIQFSGKRLLRMAIVLFGLKLNLDVILHHGVGLLLRDMATITFSIVVTMWLARWLKADQSLSLLLGIGTGVCGAAAIAAVSPILNAKEEDTAVGAGLIALIGTLFAVGYTVIRPMLPISSTQYGIWAGVSLHEIAQVALAAAPAGQNALAIAILAKLGRVFLLVPLSFALMGWMGRRRRMEHSSTAVGSSGLEFPWFLIGFVGMSFVGTYILRPNLAVPSFLMADLSNVTTFLLTMAMVGLGLNVSFKQLRTRALRSMVVMVLVSSLLSMFSLLTVCFI